MASASAQATAGYRVISSLPGYANMALGWRDVQTHLAATVDETRRDGANGGVNSLGSGGSPPWCGDILS